MTLTFDLFDAEVDHLFGAAYWSFLFVTPICAFVDLCKTAGKQYIKLQYSIPVFKNIVGEIQYFADCT